MLTAIALLLAAIGIEVAATALLPRAEGFTEPSWTAVVLGGYGVSIWLLAIVVRTLPVSSPMPSGRESAPRSWPSSASRSWASRWAGSRQPRWG